MYLITNGTKNLARNKRQNILLVTVTLASICYLSELRFSG